MVDFFARNQDNLILGFFFAFFGAVLGVIVASLREDKRKDDTPSTITTIINIDNSITTNIGRSPRAQPSQDDSTPMVIGAIILACCFGYIYYRHEILLILTNVSLFSVSFFMGSTLYAYAKGRIGGPGWGFYLLLASGFTIFSFIFIGDAVKPHFSPAGFEDFQEVLRQQKIGGFIKLYGWNTVTWLIPHVAGVFIFLYAQFRLTLSLVHYLALVRLESSLGASGFARFAARNTKKYNNPIMNGVALGLSALVAYLLTNGYAYLLYMEYLAPQNFPH